MRFDLAEVPFSRYGSYLALSQRPDGVYLRSVHGDAPRREICRIEILRDDMVLDYSICAEAALLRLECAAGAVEIVFADAETIRLRGTGVGLRLTFQPELYDSAVAQTGGWAINSYSNRLQCALIPLAGVLTIDAPWHIDRAARLRAACAPDAGGVCELVCGEFQSTWPCADGARNVDFGASLRAADREFKRWLATVPSCPALYKNTRELAAYVTWSAVVAATGLFKRPAMLMSKNWLTQVWSWDHCFNAMALTYKNPALAWDQLLLPFDYQDKFGALPDAINDKHTVWNFCKPPLHGWALAWMLQRSAEIGESQLRAIYAPLSRWTDWWMTERAAANGLPQYYHGNDSGWDNCTLFEAGLPSASPDLAALLVLQMETLADIAQRLHKPRAASSWQRRADDLLAQLLENFWCGDRFIARRADHPAAAPDTLLLFVPLVLGARLPKQIRDHLVAGLRARFVTAHGLASESPASARYEADGYWRGPIWAPAVLLIVDGLRACGERALARDIGRRFCDTVARSGMAENFDALSGAGLRDRAHTWTASVFLILAHEYLQK